MSASTDTGNSGQQTSSSAPTAELKNGSYGTRHKDYGPNKEDLELETFDLIAKVIDLLDTHELWEPDGTYTFKDGERWARLDIGDEDE